MTWQRVDENTYIDDSLVTCAEYQLFIDEMREQGKYYQPDHWTSYQFPAGQALVPILGIRPSDAQSFCIWLTLNAGGTRTYRLPSIRDVKDYPIVKTQHHTSLGYWVTDINNTIEFSWIGTVPYDPRGIAQSYENFIQTHPDTILLKHKPINRMLLPKSKEIKDAQELDFTIERLAKRGYGINIRELFEIVDYKHDRKEIDKQKKSLERLIINTNVLSLNLSLDFFTLQERIAGRSPAFEGIRLVKERIR